MRAPRTRARERRVALALFCVCLLAYGAFVYRGPHHNPDSRLALTYAIVERGALDIAPDAAGTLDRAIVGGRVYTDKAPGLSLLLVPLYAGLRLVLPDTLLGPGDRFVARYLLTFFGLGVPAALFAAFLFSWMGRVEGRIAPRLAVAGGYALGSPVYPFVVSAFGHVPAGMALFGAFLAVRRMPALAGGLLGLAVTIEYPAALAALPVVLYGVWDVPRGRPRRARLLAMLAGAALPLLLLGAYHQAVFGRPWAVGYANLDPAGGYAGQGRGLLGVGLPDPATALALLVGLRRGLLLHAPWLALALPGAVLLWRRCRATGAAALGVCGLLLAVNAGYVYWDGGASWGPRHLVPALPFLTLLALPAAARWPRAGLLLAAASVALTVGAVATRTLPEPEVPFPLRDLLLPRVLAGGVTNNWGQLWGLGAWRGLAPGLAVCFALAAWATGWRRSWGWLVAVLWSLLALATLNRAYLEYSEGYYLYLGARLAAGARLYADAASTQPPLLPLLVAPLWRLAPDVVLPRILAVALYALAAVLAGRLARRLSGSAAVGALATGIAALLPLGAGSLPALDANGALAPLVPALALLAPRRPLLAGLLAAAGLSIKLTFLPFALAPLGAALLAPGGGGRRIALPYLAGLSGAVALHLGVWLAVAGGAALDGVLGELESPLLPFGALLALAQLAQLEGLLVALAAWGWWRSRPLVRPPEPCRAAGPALDATYAWWCALAAGALPLLALHQGTFVGVVRPAEPLVAVYGALAVAALAGVRRGRAIAPVALGAALALPLWHDLRALPGRRLVDPAPIVARLEGGGRAGDVLAPPYYAALAGRRMLFDYADWTVWGMRTSAGAPHEGALTRRLIATLEEGDLPVVAADFRLAYIPGVAEALERGYVRTGEDGDDPARSVALFVPR